MNRVALLIASLLIGCGVELADPRNVMLLCGRDSDCPAGVCSANGYCVEERDETPLRLEAAVAASLTTVELRFDDTLGAGENGNFEITPDLSVIAVERGDDPRSLVITTSEQAFGAVYEITVAGLVDEQSNPLAADAVRTSFISFLGLPSSNAPVFLSPSAGAVVRTPVVRFAWTATAGATSYSLDVATDEDFTVEPQHIDTSELTLDVTAPRDVTYYARLRADTTSAGSYSSVSFERINDVVYVRCDAAPCNRVGSGSRGSPLASIALGVLVARTTGAAEVRVAARPLGEAYHENLVVSGRGVRLRGGFAPDFSNATPDRALYPTAIEAFNTVIDVSEIPANGGDVLIDSLDVLARGPAARGVSARRVNAVEGTGLRVYAGNDDGSSTSAIAIQTLDDSADQRLSLLVHDSMLVTLPAAAEATALAINGGRFVVRDSVINVNPSGSGRGILADNFQSGSEVDGCAISVSGPQGGTAGVFASPGKHVYIHDSSFRILNEGVGDKGRGVQVSGPVTIERTHMEVTTTLAASVGSALELSSEQAIVRNSTMVAGNGVAALRLLSSRRTGAPSTLLSDSTLVSTAGTVVIALSTNWSMTNSLLVGPSCVEEVGPAFPASFVGNALACSTLYSPYHAPPVAPLTAIADVQALDGASYCDIVVCQSKRRVNSNIAVVATAASLFTGFGPALVDLHLSGTAPAELCSSGVDASASLCGALDAPAVACGGDGTDYDGETRGAPYCIGMDER